jgi:hypothetical protein
MRFVIAMLVAIVVAALATVFLSPTLASMAVDRFTFDNPDDVGTLEDSVYMLSSLTALLVGWGIGWLVGGKIVRPHAPVA